MATVDKQGVVTMRELIVSSLAHTDAVAKLLIEKGVFTQNLNSPSIIRYPCYTAPLLFYLESANPIAEI